MYNSKYFLSAERERKRKKAAENLQLLFLFVVFSVETMIMTRIACIVQSGFV